MSKFIRSAVVVAFLSFAICIYASAASTEIGTPAVLSRQQLYIDGTPSSLPIYAMEGHNYIQLRQLAEALDFDLSYDGDSGRIYINTHFTYSEPAVEAAAPASWSVESANAVTINGVTAFSAYSAKGRSYIQLRELSYYAGWAITYHAETDCVELDTRAYAGELLPVEDTATEVKELPIQTENLVVERFDGTYLYVCKKLEDNNARYTVYGLDGRQILPWQTGRMAQQTDNVFQIEAEGGVIYYTSDGTQVNLQPYPHGTYFNDGIAAVQDSDGVIHIIDHSGTVIQTLPILGYRISDGNSSMPQGGLLPLYSDKNEAVLYDLKHGDFVSVEERPAVEEPPAPYTLTTQGNDTVLRSADGNTLLVLPQSDQRLRYELAGNFILALDEFNPDGPKANLINFKGEPLFTPVNQEGTIWTSDSGAVFYLSGKLYHASRPSGHTGTHGDGSSVLTLPHTPDPRRYTPPGLFSFFLS